MSPDVASAPFLPAHRRHVLGALGLLALTLPLTAGPVRFVEPEKRVALGRVQALAVELEQPARGDLALTLEAAPAGVVTVEPEAVVLGGARRGYVFFTPLAPGRCELVVRGARGEARCALEVVADRLRPGVTLLTPARGASLWGAVQVCARALDLEPVTMRLFADDTLLAEGPGPLLEVAFDASSMPGTRALRVEAVDASGNRAEHVRRVRCVRPAEGDLTVAGAERIAAVAPLGALDPQPPTLYEDADGRRLAGIFSQAQMVQLRFEAAEERSYQLLGRMRADVFHAFPNVRVHLDAAAVAAGPVAVSEGLGRVALGGSFAVSPGEHVLTVVFYNDAYEPDTREDRNLHVERLELLRLGPGEGEVARPLSLLLSPADGALLGGAATVTVLAYDDTAVREIRLLCDGEELLRRPGDRLLTSVSLPPGAHTLQAVAYDLAGNPGESHPVRVRRLPCEGVPVAPQVRYALDALGAERPSVAPAAPGRYAWGLYGETQTVSFELPVRHRGRYELELLARADLFEGAPRALVMVDGEERGELTVPSTGYVRHGPLALELEPGKRTLTIALRGDRYDPETGGDRNLWLAGLALWPAGEAHPPRLRWLGLAEGDALRGPTLLCAEVSDESEVACVELLVDGAPVARSGDAGRVGLWLPAGLEGERALELRAVDRYGNESRTAPVRVRILPPAEALNPSERGVHLLQRLGVGYSEAALVALLRRGEAAWLDAQLAPAPAAGEPVELLFFPLLRNDPNNGAGLRLGWLARAVLTRQVVRERLTGFLEDHFNTWLGKTDAWREWFSHLGLRAAAFDELGTLLTLSTLSPAMLDYLDNSANRAGALNENLARELLELHSLGVRGGYSQRDVEEVARVLSGCTTTLAWPWFELAFYGNRHDGGAKQILGVPFPAGAGSAELGRLFAVLGAHPSTPEHWARKLVRGLVSDEPPAALVARLADALGREGKLDGAVRALVEDPVFFDRAHVGTKVKDPLALVIGLHRVPLTALEIESLDGWLTRLGQSPFGCPTPDGYPDEEQAWLHSSALLARWSFAEFVAARLDLDRLLGRSRDGLGLDLALDDLSLGLLGRPLAPRSREAVRAACAELELDEPGLRRVARAILLTPDMQRH